MNFWLFFIGLHAGEKNDAISKSEDTKNIKKKSWYNKALEDIKGILK